MVSEQKSVADLGEGELPEVLGNLSGYRLLSKKYCMFGYKIPKKQEKKNPNTSVLVQSFNTMSSSTSGIANKPIVLRAFFRIIRMILGSTFSPFGFSSFKNVSLFPRIF